MCVAFRRYRYAVAGDVRTFVMLPSNRFPWQPAPVEDNMASGFFVRRQRRRGAERSAAAGAVVSALCRPSTLTTVTL